MWILIRWLRKKPADLDLHCFKKNSINPGSTEQGQVRIKDFLIGGSNLQSRVRFFFTLPDFY